MVTESEEGRKENCRHTGGFEKGDPAPKLYEWAGSKKNQKGPLVKLEKDIRKCGGDVTSRQQGGFLGDKNGCLIRREEKTVNRRSMPLGEKQTEVYSHRLRNKEYLRV